MNSECSICYNEPNPKFTLLCNHDFCGGCILQWCRINSNCPMCRHKISEDDILIYNIKNHDNNKAEAILKRLFTYLIKYNHVAYYTCYTFFIILANPWPWYKANVYMYQKWIS